MEPHKIEAQKGYSHLTQAAAKNGENDYLQGMAVAIDPFTGDIRALVGGRNYSRAPFNSAVTSLRQPGSSIKPIVYAKAIEDSVPAERDHPGYGSSYRPSDAVSCTSPRRSAEFSGRHDDPRGTDPVAQHGCDPARDFASAWIPSRRSRSGWASIRQWFRCRQAPSAHPRSIRSISSPRTRRLPTTEPLCSRGSSPGSMISSGRAVFQRPPSTPQQVLDPRVAFIVRDMMKDVAERGSGMPARAAGAGRNSSRRQDRYDERQRRRLVRRHDARARRRRLARLRPPQDDLSRCRTAAVWRRRSGARWWAAPIARTAHSAWAPPPDGLVYAELDRDIRRARDGRDPARRALRRVFHSRHRARAPAQQPVEGAAVGPAVHAEPPSIDARAYCRRRRSPPRYATRVSAFSSIFSINVGLRVHRIVDRHQRDVEHFVERRTRNGR